jgi:SAM-dependent methyltransferase
MINKDFFKNYKYPLEEYYSKVPKDDHGWFPRWNQELLLPKVANKKLVVELGSWLGKSTRMWLKNSQANVICIDTWQGSIEHNKKRKDIKNKLSSLKDTFLCNQEEWRDRVFPLQMNTVKGMVTISNYGLEPDFIYIDASHQYEDVYTDLSLAYNCFPGALICGDDWGWRNRSQGRRMTVQEAVKEFCKNNKIQYIYNKWAWYLKTEV